MFYHLKPWQSWRVVPFSFIWMSKNSNQKYVVLLNIAHILDSIQLFHMLNHNIP